MICKNCGKEFEGQFCPECGTKAAELQKCPVCGKERVEGEKFCANCGYNYTQQNAVVAPQIAQTSNTKKLSGVASKAVKAVSKKYWIIPAVGTLLLGVLLFLTLRSPVMLHEGYDISGIGFKHIFKVNIDYVFTVTCAIILVMSIFVIILGIARIINAVAKPYTNIKDKKSYIIDGVICVAVLALGIAGAANAGNWFGSAGAGYTLCISIGIFGIALVALRYIFENKFIDSDIVQANGQKIKDKGYIKNNADVKINKGIKKGSIVLASLIIVALVIGIIVSSIYINPFNATSFKTVQTRGDIIKQFGLPEGAKSDASSFTYIGGEISGYNYLDNNLEALADEQLGEGLESESDEDLEEAFGGLMKLDAVIEKLNEKAEVASSKKTTVYFNSDGGEDRNADTVSSYICEVSSLKNTVDGVAKRELKDLKILDTSVMQYTSNARVEYIAKYDDGSFIKNSVDIEIDKIISNEKQLPVEVEFGDVFGKYSTFVYKLNKMEVDYFVDNNTLNILSNVNEISLPDNINIGDITKIVVNDGVAAINKNTFAGFTNVQEIVLPDARINIDKGAFADTAYYKDSANWHNGEVLYIGNHLIEAKTSLNGSYIIKENTKYINERAFSDCSELISITIPDSLTIIGWYAFYGCSSLKTITIPDSVTNIGWYAFSNCSSLKTITIPDSVTRIEDETFSNCSILTSIIIPDSVTSIGSLAFSNCSSLTEIIIPYSVANLNEKIFDGCDSLTIYCEAAFEPVGWDDDWNINNCQVVWGYNNITTNADYDYLIKDDGVYLTRYKGTDTQVYVPKAIDSKEVVSIGITFSRNQNLTSIVIPDSVTSIGYAAFAGCTSLTSVTIGDSVTSIGSSAFYGCTSLTSIVIPDSVTSIGMGAFITCSSLTRIVIPDSVTSMGMWIFMKCSSLTIYCEAASQPSGWDSSWNGDRPVVWGYTG